MTSADKPSFLKRLLKIVLILVVLLAVLIALAPTLFSGFIKDAVVEAAETKMDGKMEIEDFSFGWTSGLELSGLRFTRKGQSEAALEIGHASAQPAIFAALSGNYEVKDVEVRDVTLRVIAEAEKAKAPAPEKPKTEKKEPKQPGEKKPKPVAEPISVPDFLVSGSVKNLRVVYQDAKGSDPVEIAGLNLAFRSSADEKTTLNLDGPAQLSAKLEATLFRDGKLLDQSEMRAEGNLRLPRAQLDELARGLAAMVQVEAGRILVEQDFVYAGGALDIKGRVEVDNLVANREKTSVKLGVGNITNDLVMGTDGMSGKLELRVTKTEVNGLERQVAPFVVDDLETKLNMPSTEVVRVESGSVTMPYGRIDVSGEMRQDGASGIAMKGGLDLGAMAALFDDLPALSGQLRLNGTAQREGELMRFRGNHKAEGLSAESMTPGGPSLVNETMSLAHDISLSGGLMDLTMIDLKSSFANLKAAGLRVHMEEDYRIENYGQEANPLVGSLDLDRLSTLAGETMPARLRGHVDLAARMKTVGQVESAAVSMVVDALEMSGGKLGEKTLNAGRTRIDVELKDLALGAASPIDLVASSRIFDLRGGTAFTAKPEALYGRTGTLTLAGTAQLNELLAPFMTADHYGKADLQLDLELQDDGLRLGRMRVNDKALALDGSGQLKEVDGDQKMDFQFKSGHYATAEGARLQFQSLQLNGRRGTTNDVIDFKVQAKDLVTKSAAPDASPVQAGDLAAQISGTYDAVNSVADLRVDQLVGGGMDLKGNLNWSSAGGLQTLKLQGPVNWQELASRFLTLMDPAASGRGSSPIDINLTSKDGTMTTSTGRMDLKIPGLKLKGFDLGNLDLAASLAEGKGKVERGKADLNGGQVTLGGDIDMTLEEPQFGSRFTAKSVQIVKEWQPALARVIPIFAGVGVNFSGVMDADIDLRGQGSTWDVISKALNGNGNVALRSAAVEGAPILDMIGAAVGFSPDMKINDLATQFLVKDGGVYQDNLLIKTGVIDLKLSGTTYLDGRLDYNLGLKPVGDKPARWQQFLALVSSDGYLPLGLAGTVTSPSPKLPNPETLIRKGAEDLIKKGIGDILNKKTGNDEKATGDEKKPENPIGGIIDLFGGKKKKDENKDGK